MANPLKRIKDRIGINWLFLLLVLILYLVLAIFNFSLCLKSLLAALNLFKQIILVLLVVFFLIFIFDLFLSPQKIVKYLGNNAGKKGWLLAIVFGILSSGPIYMWYPLLKDLKEKGMRAAFMVTFLYNRAIKIPLLSVMVYYFGWVLVFLLNFYMIIFSVINGWLVEKILKRNK